MEVQKDQIQSLHFLFVTRNPEVQDISLDFEEFFRSFDWRMEKVKLHYPSELVICYSSSITQYFNFSIVMLLIQIS